MESGKRRRGDHELSLSPSEADVDNLLGMHTSEAQSANGSESNLGAANEDEDYLKSLEADLADDDPVGTNIQQNLANIASKRWGISLSPDKLKALLNKHTKPANCTDITVAKVNPEI